ncbi:MAG: glycosyltransferase family 4 protein [bacterium]|nr:glycosyltransferase family 4 protein [bacterium]
MSGKRFLIDGSGAKRGGGFTYLVNVLPELSRLAPNDKFRVVVCDQRVAESIPTAPNVEVQYLGDLGARGRMNYTYRQAGRLAKDWGADVYFSAGELAPLNAPCPTIAAFRNPNIFNWQPDDSFGPKQRLRLWMLYGLAAASAARADRVMFVSEDSADWIGDSIRLPKRKRAVIHHGIDASRWQRPAGERSAGSYILSVSSVYPYKNYVRLIQAYAELYGRNPAAPDLVIIGDDQDPAYSEKMAATKAASGDAQDSIHILGEVPYGNIVKYYRDAALFVFPSYLETFGHPLLEAMANDIPLVAADIPVFREIANDAAIYADPYDTSSMASAMEAALASETVAELMVKRGRECVRHFTWQRSAESLLALFEEVLEEASKSVAVSGRSSAHLPSTFRASQH